MSDKEKMQRAIKSVIYGAFKNETECASVMGWPRQRLNKITNGAKEPSVSEMGAIALATGSTLEKISNIFLLYW